MRQEVYRRRAAQCLSVAAKVTDPESRRVLIEMAGAWVRLAEQAEKNSQVDLVYEVPARPTGPLR